MFISRNACLLLGPVKVFVNMAISYVAVNAKKTQKTTGNTTELVAMNASARMNSARAAVQPIRVCLVGTLPAILKNMTMTSDTELVALTASGKKNSVTALAHCTEVSLAEKPPVTKKMRHKVKGRAATSACQMMSHVTEPAPRTSCLVERSA